MDKDDFKATASERSLDSVQLVASMLLCFPARLLAFWDKFSSR